MTIAGREAVIEGYHGCFYITSPCRDCGASYYLQRDGEWYCTTGLDRGFWPSREAAQAFIDRHADKPTPSDPNWLEKQIAETQAEVASWPEAFGGKCLCRPISTHGVDSTGCPLHGRQAAGNPADAGKMVAVGEGRELPLLIDTKADDDIRKAEADYGRELFRRAEAAARSSNSTVEKTTGVYAIIRPVHVKEALSNWHPTTAETERLRGEVERLTERLSLLGDVPDPHENTLFGLSAHHTWHHQQENKLTAELTALREQLAAVERERDALLAQMKATGHVPYLERMSELAARAEKAEAANSRLQAELTTLKHAHANHFADVRRVTEWAAGDRSALFSFTDGPERQMAYLVEAERRRVREEWSAVSVK